MSRKAKIDILRETLIKEGKLRLADSPEFIRLAEEFADDCRKYRMQYKQIEQKAWESAGREFFTD